VLKFEKGREMKKTWMAQNGSKIVLISVSLLLMMRNSSKTLEEHCHWVSGQYRKTSEMPGLQLIKVMDCSKLFFNKFQKNLRQPYH